jgi:hypothetical protein
MRTNGSVTLLQIGERADYSAHPTGRKIKFSEGTGSGDLMTSPAVLDSESVDVRDPGASAGASLLQRHRADIFGVVVVCVVMLIGFFQVPFAGKTFSTASYVAGFGGCGTATGACNANKLGDPRPDGGASAWQLEPWARVTHHVIANGEVPLWNPYQGIGTPLAADPPTAAFDPLMLAVFLHPTEFVSDLSTLLWLLLIGVTAYFAARSIRLSPLAATMVGVVYGLSGWFFAYSNNWFFRVYLFLPLIIATIEWTIRSKRRLPPALLGISLGWIVLVGMPEPMFMAVAAAGFFAVARLVTGDREGTRREAAVRLVGAGTIGLALAAPLILGYREYLSLSFNTHPFTGVAPATDSLHQLVDWMAPRITPAPAKALFDDREWIGAGAFLLAVVAVFHPRSMRRYAGWPLLVVTAIIGLQIYGGRYVAWTGHIPLWSQVGWTRFGTPVLALTAALLAGVGLQTVLDSALDRRRLIAAAGVLVVTVVALVVRDPRDLALWHDVPLRGGWPLAAVTFIVVALVACFLNRRYAGPAIAIVVIFEILLLAPYGIYADRQNPYPSPPWISFLQSRTHDDQSRVFSTQGWLYPDVASVYGLSDPRVLDALYPKRYWLYLSAFVAHGLADRFTAVDPNEPAPNFASNPMFDLLGVRYLVFHEGGDPRPAGAKAQFRRVYQAGGVQILENLHAAPRAFVVHDVRAVRDVNAALALLAPQTSKYFPDGSVRVGHFDPQSSAVIETTTQAAPPQSCARDAVSSTNIVSYSATEMKFAVNNSCPGLLVVSDQYFPGWSATVNGHHATILPTDVALRGVPVPAGSSTVVLSYRPASFRFGLILFAIGALALVFLSVTGLRSTRWWRGRRAAHDG